MREIHFPEAETREEKIGRGLAGRESYRGQFDLGRGAVGNL